MGKRNIYLYVKVAGRVQMFVGTEHNCLSRTMINFVKYPLKKQLIKRHVYFYCKVAGVARMRVGTA